MTKWTAKDIPSQAGKTAVVTGAGGLGYETALELARAGAEVTIAGRNPQKGAAAVTAIRDAAPQAKVQFGLLDLASLASIAAFAEAWSKSHETLDILVNNAGVMAPPTRHVTQDGFELQFGTNYLGHYALTAHLLPPLRRALQPRVVNLSSLMHRFGSIRLDDLQWEHGYEARAAYSQSKLAMLMYAFELQRRSAAHGWGLMSNAAHPGYAVTELQSTGPRLGTDGKATFLEKIGTFMEPYVAHSAAAGALPTLYAATAAEALRGGYYGPNGFMEIKGAVAEAGVSAKAKDTAVASKLWDASQTLTHVSWG